MTSSPNRTAIAAGKKFQTDVLKYLREAGIKAERLVLAGQLDEGDIYAAGAILELKAERRINLAGYLKEAKVEAENYAKARGEKLPDAFAVVKARGKGIGQAYVIQTLDDWIKGRKP